MVAFPSVRSCSGLTYSPCSTSGHRVQVAVLIAPIDLIYSSAYAAGTAPPAIPAGRGRPRKLHPRGPRPAHVPTHAVPADPATGTRHRRATTRLHRSSKHLGRRRSLQIYGHSPYPCHVQRADVLSHAGSETPPALYAVTISSMPSSVVQGDSF